MSVDELNSPVQINGTERLFELVKELLIRRLKCRLEPQGDQRYLVYVERRRLNLALDFAAKIWPEGYSEHPSNVAPEGVSYRLARNACCD